MKGVSFFTHPVLVHDQKLHLDKQLASPLIHLKITHAFYTLTIENRP